MKIEPTGDRKRKGVGWEWRKESMKKNVFPSSFYLSVSFLVFSRASWSFSRAHQIVQNKRNVCGQSRFLWCFQSFTPSLSLTSIHRKFADHRLSLRVKTRHRPTSNPIKKLMSRDDIRSELWVQFVSWRDLGTATASHRIPRQVNLWNIHKRLYNYLLTKGHFSLECLYFIIVQWMEEWRKLFIIKITMQCQVRANPR